MTAAPRWKTAIENALSKHKNQTVIQIATIDLWKSPEGPTPRVRSHIFRSFLSNPSVPSLPLLLSSTDIRTPKVHQITSASRSEVVWWIEGVRQQFRFIADILIVPAPTHPLHAQFTRRLEEARDGTGVALYKNENNEDWESRRVDLFKAMSPYMKASWCRPTPGTPLMGGWEEAKTWPQRVLEPDGENMTEEEHEEAKRNWDMALENFALVVIDPVEVDFVDLHEPPDRRSFFTKRKDREGWAWDEIEVVP